MTDKLYYRDSSLLEFSGRVLAITMHDGRSAVRLDRTAFYPTSGGQPHDLGTLGGASVIDVVDAGDDVLHVLDGTPPPVGATVVGRIDPIRRRDHTQQHTGQHVLSQAFEQIGQLRTVSFHLGIETCTIDLDVPELAESKVAAAEELANQIVLEDRTVIVHFATGGDVASFSLRKPTDRQGDVRIVEIEGFDRSACGGTHVRRTGEIGPIKVRRWERRGEVSRVEFLCGWRALRDYARRTRATRTLAERLSVGDADVLEAVSRALDELERRRDETDALRARLLAVEARELLREARDVAGSAASWLVRQTFVDRSPDELKRLALLLVREGGVVALLGSTGDRGHVVLAQSPGLPHDLSAILRQVGPPAGVRGGGTRDLAQGGGPAGADVGAALRGAEERIVGASVAASDRNVQ